MLTGASPQAPNLPNPAEDKNKDTKSSGGLREQVEATGKQLQRRGIELGLEKEHSKAHVVTATTSAATDRRQLHSQPSRRRTQLEPTSD